jgi:hypothetical protein
MVALATMPVPPPGSCAFRALGRLLGFVASGVVDFDVLARKLREEPDALRARVQLATWLGFFEGPGGAAGGSRVPRLSRRGLELVFSAGRRPRVYAEALWDHPVVAPILALRPGRSFQATELYELVAQRHPELDPERVEQIAASLAVVIQPGLRQRPRRRDRRPSSQLRLAFARPRAPVTGYRFRASPQQDQGEHCSDPAVYRAVLQALLDEGELAVSQLSAVVEGLGLEAPVGLYAEMAVRRGDAQRLVDGSLDKLVVTPAAIARRELSDTVASVALSDPDYRGYLEVLRAVGQGDLGAAARYGKLRTRFRCWDARIFGQDITPRAMAQAAAQLLDGRTMAAIPAAVPEPELGYLPRSAPFVDLIEHRNLVVALPPSIDLLVSGLAAVKGALSSDLFHPAFAPRALVHGGLLHPGERGSGPIPDGVSLRLHVIERVPHLALLVAVLLQQRISRGRVSLRLQGERLRLYHRRRDLGSFLIRADELMSDRGWLVSRRQRGGFPEASLADVAEVLGIAVRCGRLLVLTESFFRRLLSQPEDRHLHDRLQPLGVWAEERLGEWAVGVEPPPLRATAEPSP